MVALAISIGINIFQAVSKEAREWYAIAKQRPRAASTNEKATYGGAVGVGIERNTSIEGANRAL